MSLRLRAASAPRAGAAVGLAFALVAHEAAAQSGPPPAGPGAPAATAPAPAVPPVDPESLPPPSPRRPFGEGARGPLGGADPDPADAIVWRDEWPRFRTWQYVLTGIQAGVALGSSAIPSGGGRLPIRNGFDAEAREALRAETYSGYLVARDLSDVGLVLLINHRIADSLFVTWWGYDKGSVAWEMAMIDIQTVSFTAAVNGIVAGVTARERPYADRNCVSDDALPVSECTGSRRYRSFFSGHSSTAWTLAGLTCMHHAHVPLYGHPVADGAACVGAIGAAGTVAMMRVVADQHWASDVMVGSAFGLTSGLAIPWFLHYSGGASIGAPDPDPSQPDPSQPDPSQGGRRRAPGVAWTVAPTPGGASFSGIF